MQPLQKPYLLFFYIWGIEWITSGLLDFFDPASTFYTIKLILLLLAILASLLILIRSRSQNSKLPQPDKQSWLSIQMLIPLIILISSLCLLWWIAASDKLLIIHALRVLLLAFSYVLIGVLWRNELIWLGCWLFDLSAIVSIWYLGYAPFLFEGIGGISLLAGGWVLQRKVLPNK